MMQVGRREISTSKPEDLDARLGELTGYSPKEMRILLDGYCTPSILAGALLPFVRDDSLSRQELAASIAKAGVDTVRAKLRGMYDQALAKKASGDGKKEG